MNKDLELRKLNQEREIAILNANTPFNLSVITLGQNAIKTASLINGGAAVALLAFIGNVWDKGVDRATAILLARSISIFAAGVLSTALGSGATYCSQHLLVSGRNTLGRSFQWVAIVFIICSYILFGWATWSAHNAFLEHFLQ